MTVERADWLVNNQMVGRREGSLAGQPTSGHEQVISWLDTTAEGWVSPCKRVRIPTADGITEEGLCLLFGRILSGEVWSGDSVRGGDRSGDAIGGGSV